MFTKTSAGGGSSSEQYGYISTAERHSTHTGYDTQEETTTYTATKDTKIDVFADLFNYSSWKAYIIFYINDVEVGRIENPSNSSSSYESYHRAIINIKNGDEFKVKIKSYRTGASNNYFYAYVAP